MKPNTPLKRWRVFYSRIFVLFFLFFFSAANAQAQEQGLNFYVTPEFPESQIDENTSYYDLNVAAGTTETLVLNVQNATDESIQIQLTPHTAYTNVLGVVEYGKDAQEPDPTLQYSLAEMIETPEPITLAGNEKKTVTMPLHMPEEAFEGILAGGVKISEVPKESDDTQETQEGVAIKNEFSYVVGIVVSNQRTSVTPALELLSVFASQLNYRNVISATLQNRTPTFVNRLAVEARVHKKGEETILYEATQEQMQMAPNSQFDFPISLAGDRFESGTYVLEMTASSGEEEWTWMEEFTIEADTARSLNRSDVTIDTGTNWWMMGMFLLLGVLIMLCLFLLHQKKQLKKGK